MRFRVYSITIIINNIHVSRSKRGCDEMLDKKSHFDHDTSNAVIMINVIIISIYANINIITTIMNIIIFE